MGESPIYQTQVWIPTCRCWVNSEYRKGNWQGKAGMGAESDIRCGMTLRRQLLGGIFPPKRALLTGSSHGEKEPKKATYVDNGAQQKSSR